ncbi:hypothetical protein PJF56_16815 [Roseofilum sp. BLCC_M91]|uniref:Outer membrane protein beta-barrel domain-containing protein n=1 Tax=Roseofilum halophilum BLCC-M91 TaxID=3022259 RepID=A0ABT7BMW5_9CYAN|nr:hypothetical protein [Roseofilum halophilum]MDJ1180525.1 hypothetical protein [Roseofilum halophilum BLCC-M91]
MNHIGCKLGCKAIALLAFWGGIGGANSPLQLAQAQTTRVMYGNYLTISAPTPEPTPASAAEKQLEPPPPVPLSPSPNTESVEPEQPTAQQTSLSDPRPPVGSYFGIGGTIGLTDGETALGSGGFSLMSKGALSEYLTLHNATSFGKQTASMFALTGEFPIRNGQTQEVVAMPFLGGGTLVTTQDEWRFHGLIVGGVDVPLSRDFMGTVRVNTGFVDGKTEVGIVLGVGYRFNLFNLF